MDHLIGSARMTLGDTLTCSRLSTSSGLWSRLILRIDWFRRSEAKSSAGSCQRIHAFFLINLVEKGPHCIVVVIYVVSVVEASVNCLLIICEGSRGQHLLLFLLVLLKPVLTISDHNQQYRLPMLDCLHLARQVLRDLAWAVHGCLNFTKL